jgi:hypothetical protein
MQLKCRRASNKQRPQWSGVALCNMHPIPHANLEISWILLKWKAGACRSASFRSHIVVFSNFTHFEFAGPEHADRLLRG